MDLRDKFGRFIKGVRSHPETEFKKGQHWRSRKLFWDKEWLFNEYVTKGRTILDIANQFGVTDSAISFWLGRHKIKGRTTTETRSKKHWGSSGSANGMFGRSGENNPHWLGGVTPDRQAFYASLEWKKVSCVIWKRDGGKCQRCRHSGSRRRMHIHHIVSFSVKELRSDPNNLVLLCKSCHQWVHSKENKNQEFIRG